MNSLLFADSYLIMITFVKHAYAGVQSNHHTCMIVSLRHFYATVKDIVAA